MKNEYLCVKNYQRKMFEKVRKFVRIKTSLVVCDAIMLHRVRQEKSVIKSNAMYEITPGRLEEIVAEYRKRGFEFISADRLAELLLSKSKTKGKFVCLTFDDGYRDNFELAFPLLKRLDCPFIVFVNIDNLNRNSVQWRYVLDRLLTENESITLSDGVTYECRSIEKKNEVFHVIDKKYCDCDIETIKGLFVPYHIDWQAEADTLMMTRDMIREMAKDDICTIGSHAIRHCHIAWLSEEEQRDELKMSKEILEEITGKEVAHFAYPFGNHSNTTVEIAKTMYKSAFMARGGKVRKGEDVFEITRFILN